MLVPDMLTCILSYGGGAANGEKSADHVAESYRFDPKS